MKESQINPTSQSYRETLYFHCFQDCVLLDRDFRCFYLGSHLFQFGSFFLMLLPVSSTGIHHSCSLVKLFNHQCFWLVEGQHQDLGSSTPLWSHMDFADLGYVHAGVTSVIFPWPHWRRVLLFQRGVRLLLLHLIKHI